MHKKGHYKTTTTRTQKKRKIIKIDVVQAGRKHIRKYLSVIRKTKSIWNKATTPGIHHNGSYEKKKLCHETNQKQWGGGLVWWADEHLL